MSPPSGPRTKQVSRCVPKQPTRLPIARKGVNVDVPTTSQGPSTRLSIKKAKRAALKRLSPKKSKAKKRPYSAARMQAVFEEMMANPDKSTYSFAQESGIPRREVITLNHVGKLFGKAWNKAATPKNAMSGFKDTGIYPFDPNVVSDVDFAPSEPLEFPGSRPPDAAGSTEDEGSAGEGPSGLQAVINSEDDENTEFITGEPVSIAMSGVGSISYRSTGFSFPVTVRPDGTQENLLIISPPRPDAAAVLKIFEDANRAVDQEAEEMRATIGLGSSSNPNAELSKDSDFTDLDDQMDIRSDPVITETPKAQKRHAGASSGHLDLGTPEIAYDVPCIGAEVDYSGFEDVFGAEFGQNSSAKQTQPKRKFAKPPMHLTSPENIEALRKRRTDREEKKKKTADRKKQMEQKKKERELQRQQKQRAMEEKRQKREEATRRKEREKAEKAALQTQKRVVAVKSRKRKREQSSTEADDTGDDEEQSEISSDAVGIDSDADSEVLE